jgi:hypothetical protein
MTRTETIEYLEFEADGKTLEARVESPIARSSLSPNQMTRVIDGAQYAIFISLSGGFTARKIESPKRHLIFEETQSALYHSNDGRLRLAGHGDAFVLELDGDEVFASRDRVKVDAYIAGYDLARDSASQ